MPVIVRQLNVSHVLEGSVRKASGRVRISAQLIDGVRNDHVWAERYDREITDIFALQDEIANAIVDAPKLRLLPQERQNIERRGRSNLEAYDRDARSGTPARQRPETRRRAELNASGIKTLADFAPYLPQNSDTSNEAATNNTNRCGRRNSIVSVWRGPS